MKNPKGKPTLAHSEDSNPKWVDVQKGMVPKVIVTLNFTRHNQDYQYPFYLLTDSENKTIEAALTLTHMLKENWGGNRKNGKVLAELTLESFLSGTKKERAELYDLTDANVVKLVKNLYKLVIGESVSI